MDDPRAENITTNLVRAQDQLSIAAERLSALFATGRDAAAMITDAPRRAEFGAPTGPTGSTVRSRKVGRRPHIPSKIMLTVVLRCLLPERQRTS
jgi:hypothetical protein